MSRFSILDDLPHDTKSNVQRCVDTILKKPVEVSEKSKKCAMSILSKIKNTNVNTHKFNTTPINETYDEKKLSDKVFPVIGKSPIPSISPAWNIGKDKLKEIVSKPKQEVIVQEIEIKKEVKEVKEEIIEDPIQKMLNLANKIKKEKIKKEKIKVLPVKSTYADMIKKSPVKEVEVKVINEIKKNSSPVLRVSPSQLQQFREEVRAKTPKGSIKFIPLRSDLDEDQLIIRKEIERESIPDHFEEYDEEIELYENENEEYEDDDY